MNALRSVLYEYGHVFPIGLVHLKRMDALVQGADCDLPSLIVTECQELLAQIAETTEKIDAKTKRLKALADETDTARQTADHAGGWSVDGAGGRSLCPADGSVPMRPRLRGLARARAAAALLGRQGAPWTGFEGRPNRHPAASDHRSDDAHLGARPVQRSCGELDRPHAGKEAENAGRDCTGEQDGQAALGDADEGTKITGIRRWQLRCEYHGAAKPSRYNGGCERATT